VEYSCLAMGIFEGLLLCEVRSRYCILSSSSAYVFVINNKILFFSLSPQFKLILKSQAHFKI
jgi:hypothetical protein